MQVKFAVFCDCLPDGTDALEERIDDDIAMIWTAYDFRANGKIHHCGTDIVTLIHQDGKWLITGIADNSRTTGCPAR
ncbi:hypothetical protein [Janthinobacterium agaricidamnosum]|uniref:Uncharacterized domain protein n=1 Tax=Janthinobacterium agaricidamnosum NBRC 102515 = DSM 9628 TaxID=1349767 RepID=W0V786_9BURK|nr:hypothetical protein [Janthinobacterium agaricidamnosum]CDG83746.1 putative uncharacterized domain protein [Janthinobacterium agaricidamnosum NBRC 102515 = DSM 9628]